MLFRSLLIIVTYQSFASFEPLTLLTDVDVRCSTQDIPGDCDPSACTFASSSGGTCEGRYVRYVSMSGIDQTLKSCQCSREPICGILDMSANDGCRSYRQLSTAGQLTVRQWMMTKMVSESDDRRRHRHLINANSDMSRFCCRTVSHHDRMIKLSSSIVNNYSTTTISLLFVYSIIHCQ